MAAFITFQPSDFFNVVNYTGTGSSNAITGVGFQPDLIWTATRNEAEIHPMNDSVNGIANYLRSNAADTLETSSTETITALGADGYTVGTEDRFNQSSNTFVSWNWKGGTTSGIATNGSTTITPSAYSFSQTAGFSIIKYSGNSTGGAKVAHGLGKTPTMILVKNLGGADSWMVYQKQVKATSPEDWLMQINTSGAAVDNTMWNDTAPDDVNITLGTDNGVNGGYDYIAYCYAPIQGKQIFGRYYGNANANGPFIQTNFRPKFVVLKRLDGTTSWVMFYNPPYTENDASAPALWVDATTAEGAYTTIDFLSNGFKIRDTSAVINTNGGQHVYWAFSEFPFVSSNSKPSTAR